VPRSDDRDSSVTAPAASHWQARPAGAGAAAPGPARVPGRRVRRPTGPGRTLASDDSDPTLRPGCPGRATVTQAGLAGWGSVPSHGRTGSAGPAPPRRPRGSRGRAVAAAPPRRPLRGWRHVCPPGGESLPWPQPGPGSIAVTVTVTVPLTWTAANATVTVTARVTVTVSVTSARARRRSLGLGLAAADATQSRRSRSRPP
jgi:hypothetical protein